jgi:hypothetical protein
VKNGGNDVAKCTHVHGRTVCFECFRAGAERTRARREAYAQRSLPFDEPARERGLSPEAIAHRQRMLDYLAGTARRRA